MTQACWPAQSSTRTIPPVSVNYIVAKTHFGITKLLNMKKLSFLISCFIGLISAQAQQDSTTPVEPRKTFNTSVQTLDKKTIQGRLFTINDSQLVLKKYSDKMYAIAGDNVGTVILRRKNSALRGALIGFGIGVISGVVIGFASGDDPIVQPGPNDFLGIGAAMNNAFAMTAEEKAVACGAGLGVGGAIIGTIIGAVARKKFIIGGRKEKFRDLQAELMARIVQK
ncbi:MAG: hypothetical protein ACHQFX_17535 [Chitinophagales bacterium]